MTNELDLVFDYIPKDTIRKMKKYIGKLETTDEFLWQEIEHFKGLEQYNAVFGKIMSGSKISRNDFLFMNDLVLCNGILDFNVFSSENKNTKSALVKYLYRLYMTSSLILFFKNTGSNLDLSNDLANFYESINVNVNNPEKTETKKKGKTSKNKNNAPELNDLFSGFLSNPDIMNMAKDITDDLQREKIDPMTLMSSLMSGKPNGKINNLIKNITSKLENKINSGELDKDQLEQQANSLMTAVQKSDLVNQLPMMQMFGQQRK